MPHSYSSSLHHIVFSTKDRLNQISPEWQSDLWAYLGGIARTNGMMAIAIGGIGNHVHILLHLPATLQLAKAVQLLKGGSSKWIHETHSKSFAWQEGYGSFTVGISQKKHTIAYINGQAEHHQKRSFEDEFRAFLKAHDISFDEQYVFG